MTNSLTTTSQLLPQQKLNNPLLLPGIRTHSDQEIFNVILINIAKSFTDIGQEQPSTPTKEYMANTLADSIPKRFPSLRLHEIADAWAMGIRGKLGKFYGLNVVSFENFIEAYLDLEIRESFAKELLQKLEDNLEPDDDTKFETSKRNALEALKRKIAGSDVSLIGLSVYTFLDHLKLIPFSSEEKREFMDQAKVQIFSEYTDRAVMAKDSIERKRFKIKRDRISASMVSEALDLYRDEQTLLINRAKKLALEAFLADCIINDTDLEQLINSRKDLFIQHCQQTKQP